jgi:hypothetical protein
MSMVNPRASRPPPSHKKLKATGHWQPGYTTTEAFIATIAALKEKEGEAG